MGGTSKDARKRFTRSQVFRAWYDKSIAPDGSVVLSKDRTEKCVCVVEDAGEPECWACGQSFPGVFYTREYQALLEAGDLDSIAKIWDLRNVKLEKCHIVPFARGGADGPSNMFLLCPYCHAEAPDVTDPRGFFRWVYKQKHRGVRVGRHFVRELVEAFEGECRVLGKDPWSMKPGAVRDAVCAHFGHGVSDASLVAALVSSCDMLSDGADFDEALESRALSYGDMARKLEAGSTCAAGAAAI